MATPMQRMAAEAIMEKRGQEKIAISKIMEEVGYDPTTAKNPKNLTQSKGFKELMDECGLTDNLVLKALADDIKAKPEKRERELRLAADIKGFTKRSEDTETKPTINIVVYGNTNPVQFQPSDSPLPIEGSAEPIEVQVSDYSSQSGEDSISIESPDTTGDAEFE